MIVNCTMVLLQSLFVTCLFIADHSIAKITGQDQSHIAKPDPISPNIPVTVTNLAENENSLPNGLLEKPASISKEKSKNPKRGKILNRPPQWEALTKDHFSFNTKIKLGDFMEQKPGEKVGDIIILLCYCAHSSLVDSITF